MYLLNVLSVHSFILFKEKLHSNSCVVIEHCGMREHESEKLLLLLL